jgi:hypothetical protein
VQEKYPGYLVDSDDEPFAFDPFWGNNLEASSSTAPPIKLCLPWNASTTESSASDYVDTPHSLDAVAQPEEAHHAAPLEVVSMDFASDQQLPHGMDAAVQLVDAQLSDEQVLQQVDARLPDVSVLQQANAQQTDISVLPGPATKSKRQSRKVPTPVVDDMVRRSNRKRKPEGFRHVHLDFVKGKRGPRETSTSPVLEDHLQTIEEAAAMDVGTMIPVEAMQDLATHFCAVPLEEVSTAILLNNQSSNE